MSIIDKLERLDGGVVEITVSTDKTRIYFSDGDCGFNCIELTKAEVLALAEELVDLALTLQ